MFGAFNSSGGVSLKVRSRSKISGSRRLQFGSGGVSVISSGRKPTGALRIGMHKRICPEWGIRNVWFFQKSQAIYACPSGAFGLDGICLLGLPPTGA